MVSKSLYFTAIIPPDPLKNHIQELKFHIAKNYTTRKSLNSPPHITLIPPFQLAIHDEIQIMNQLEKFAKTVHTFMITIDGFGSFKPNVIYLKVETSESLKQLHKQIYETFPTDDKPKEKAKSFSPHVTLAFRDLSPPMFQKAWKYYASKPFRASFDAENICLLKHNGKSWDILAAFPFVSNQLPG